VKYYPVFLVLRERPCLIIGGGEVAERKTLSLLEAGADVTVVSPTLSPKLAELARTQKVRHLPRTFEEHDLAGIFLVIAATDSPEINASVARLCRKKHVLVNVAAPPEESSFIVPSVVERGDLVIAISTSGDSPGLSKRIRRELEERSAGNTRCSLHGWKRSGNGSRRRSLTRIKGGRSWKRSLTLMCSI
jgi:precorrin-2 dehydrogenase/sirohydrochlorin ferrochelatase